MINIIIEFFYNLWELLASIAIYILLGVLLAGIFKHFLPQQFIKKHMGSKGFIANIKAAIIGIPLPLCSCSVIPFIAALKKSGASKSAIQTFLISTPITGADSILATYGVMGWLFTLYRTISSLIIALLAGFLSLIFITEDNDTTAAVPSSCSGDVKETTSSSCCTSELAPKSNVSSCCDSSNEKRATTKKQSWSKILKAIVVYAFDDIYKDIAKSLLIGIALGAAIMTFMPENLTSYLSNSLVLNYTLVLLIAMPLYVCATSSVPMGLALLTGGFSPGAVFIFLTAGPATNVITMSVISKTLGKKSLIIYLASILIGSLFFAVILDLYFSDVLANIMSMAHQHEDIGLLEQVSAVILLLLSLKYIFIKNTKILPASYTDSCTDDCC